MNEHWIDLFNQLGVLAITLVTLWLRQSVIRVKQRVTNLQEDVQTGRAVRNVTLNELQTRIEELERVCGITPNSTPDENLTSV